VLEARRRWAGAPRVSLRLRAPSETFGRDGGLFVPTIDGFARSPGAVESFSASAEVQVNGLPSGRSSTFKLEGCVFEFGGSFQDPAVCKAAEDAGADRQA